MGNRPGFTLIEMLVALAVFSLAALALLNLAGENTRSAARVETRTVAGIVAENLAVQTLVDVDPPATGETRGETAMAGRSWTWVRVVNGTDDPDILSIRISITEDGEQVADVTLFRANAS
ncbi:type II secretion system minor pseudopilin GspI [Brevundimonas sp.]|uniref:type II secretion system minor pseudopilin GspI n=1 Tax=Brevundimonas sp. TaxID=1871086 RepID=UPI002ABA0369|nr:type II secretion system minor pseudopilin GspI [Brevundimonas sp.]MDZ4364983.1 type II secretion system minor pseudopilin GspI [Brevundimonas sp.]